MHKKIISIALAAAVSVAAIIMPVSAQTWQGIDVSQYQPDYDFAAAKADGAQIVYLRSSIRASEDKSFERHYAAAKAAGLKVGAYHFLWFGSYMGHSYTLDENLSAAIAAVKGKTFEGKFVIDIEGGGLQTSISKQQLTSYVLAFAQRFTAATGIPCAMYTSTYFVKDHLAAGIESLPVWLADYRKTADLSQNSIYSSWVGWQYADNGAFGNTLVDSSYYSDGILIGGSGALDTGLTRSGGATAVSSGTAPATTTPARSADVYTVKSMPYAYNATAKVSMQVTDSCGNVISGRRVDAGDRICIEGVDYTRQLAEIVYPVRGGYMHGYVRNVPSQYRSRWYNAWHNGRTNEEVITAGGAHLGTIYPHERATILYKTSGKTMVLYSTARGSETKIGLVRFAGVR